MQDLIFRSGWRAAGLGALVATIEYSIIAAMAAQEALKGSSEYGAAIGVVLLAAGAPVALVLGAISGALLLRQGKAWYAIWIVPLSLLLLFFVISVALSPFS